MSDQLNEVLINPAAKKSVEIGIDTKREFLSDIIEAGQIGNLDLASIGALTQSAQTREQSYQLIDSMAQDAVVSAVLDTYASDSVQANDAGQIVWIDSNNSSILEYTDWLLQSLNIDKHIYKWAYCLITYGDVYLRLFRQSDVTEDELFKSNKYTQRLNESQSNFNMKEPKAKNLGEAAKLKIYENSDHFIPYVQMVDNPGEMFDLQRFGKTHGYIKTPVQVMQQSTDQLYNYLTRYKINKSDVEIFDAMSFVHGSIENTSQRQPETVDIYLTPESDDANSEVDSMTCSYNVKRGQSILFNSFRIWRQLNLLEMSALLNRLTKSSIVRILNIDIGDMPRDQVQNFITRLKEKIEQKSALSVDKGMAEYTNPSPIENTIYVPTHGTQGNITAQTLGGDFDPKSLVDIEYFRDCLFGALKVPKQFFGFTDDAAGFNGGSSLTIISSRYGKSIKNIQNILIQMVTDLINLFLIDRGLDQFVNKFTVKMQPPITQEELDRRTNVDNRIRYVSDLMSQLTDIDDKVVKLKIYKSLISDVVNNPDVIQHLQEYIESIDNIEGNDTNADSSDSSSDSLDLDMTSSDETESSEPEIDDLPLESLAIDDSKISLNEEDDDNSDYLPSPLELGIDLLKN